MDASQPLLRAAAPSPADLRAPAWQMLERSLAATSLCDLDGRIVYVNPAFVALWGLDGAHAVIGKRAVEVIWSDPAQAVTAKATVMAQGAWEGEIAARRADGRAMRLWCAAHVVNAADGTPTAMMSSFIDRSAEAEVRARLERQSQFVEAVIGAAGVLVAVLDERGCFVRFNHECERLTGLRADEVIGRTFWSTVLAPDADVQREAGSFADAMRVARPGVPLRCTSVWLDADRRRRLIEWNNTLMPRGADRYIVSVGTDITQREAAQQALLTSQRRLQRAQQVADIGVWELDLASGRLEWSDQVYGIFEREPGEGIDSYAGFVAAVHPDDRAAVEHAYAASLASGRPYLIEHRLCMADGRVKWVEERCETEFGEHGQPLRSLGTVQDVTERRHRANELRRFQHMVEAASQEIWLIDAAHRVRYVNRAAADSLGYARDDLIGMPLTQIDVGGAASVDAVADEARARLAAGLAPPTFEVEHRHRDGRVVPKEVRTASVEIDGEQFGCAFAHDISERRRMQAALVASEATLRAVLLAYPGWVACIDDDLRYVYVNEQMARVVGRPREAIIGRTVGELRGEEVAREYAQIHRRLLAGEDVQLERCTPGVDGGVHRYWVQHRVTDDPARPGGHLFYVFGTELDELRRTQLRLQTIVEGAHIGTWEWNAASGAIEINDELPRLAGYARAEIDGDLARWLNARVHPDDRRARKALFLRVLQRRALSFDAEYRVMHRDGHWVWLLERGKVVSFSDSGAPLLVIGATQDVTALKRAADQLRELNDELEARVAERTRELQAAKAHAERASLAKTEFLSRMSHELRTPLNAILGFGQLLELAELPTEDAEHAREIVRAGHHLLALINEVLDLASVESGHIELLPRAMSLAGIVDECLSLIRPVAQRQDIAVTCADLSGCKPVFADRGRLKQVLLNLLSNAVKYNRPGGQVRVVCHCAAAGPVELSVSDTGPGLTAAQIERVFNPFERLGAGRSAIEGTGIGLSVSKRLMELMGGAIGVTSEPGRGSTFWLRVPAADAGDPAPDADARHGARVDAPTPPHAAPARHKLLYVEDNEANLRLMQRIVSLRPDLLLVTTADPLQAVDRALEERPDLVLLDIQLPTVDGFEVLGRLRRAGVDVPVLAVSANAMAADIERAIAAGFAEYLAKPLDVQRVLATIAAHLPAAAPRH